MEIGAPGSPFFFFFVCQDGERHWGPETLTWCQTPVFARRKASLKVDLVLDIYTVDLVCGVFSGKVSCAKRLKGWYQRKNTAEKIDRFKRTGKREDIGPCHREYVGISPCCL